MSVRITIIVAGTNEPSNSNMLADTMAHAMRARGAEITKIRLKDLRIEHFGIECYGPNCPVDDFAKVEEAVKEADGIVIASPIWNFSVPAHLVNMIDRMGAFALDPSHSIGVLKGKPFFYIYTAGMPKSAWPLMKRMLRHMTIALHYFGGAVLGTHFEGGCTLGRGIFGLVVDKRPESLKKMDQEGVRFLAQVSSYKRTGMLPLKHRWSQWFWKVAQKIKKKLGL
jgi:multimeric flavodoxin WrbA